MLLLNDIPLLFSNVSLYFLPLSMFINIDIFHSSGISSESNIMLKKVCRVLCFFDVKKNMGPEGTGDRNFLIYLFDNVFK